MPTRRMLKLVRSEDDPLRWLMMSSPCWRHHRWLNNYEIETNKQFILSLFSFYMVTKVWTLFFQYFIWQQLNPGARARIVTLRVHLLTCLFHNSFFKNTPTLINVLSVWFIPHCTELKWYLLFSSFNGSSCSHVISRNILLWQIHPNLK
jgi:hypothetical protein